MRIHRLVLFLLPLSFWHSPVLAAGYKCAAALQASSSANILFRLISKTEYRVALAEDSPLVKIQTKSQPANKPQDLWQLESVGPILAPVDFVFTKALDYQSIASSVPLIKISKISADRKTFQLGLSIPFIGGITQAIHLDPDHNSKQILVSFLEGPFKGLQGRILILGTKENTSIAQARVEGAIEKSGIASMIPTGLLENISQTILRSLKNLIERDFR